MGDASRRMCTAQLMSIVPNEKESLIQGKAVVKYVKPVELRLSRGKLALLGRRGNQKFSER